MKTKEKVYVESIPEVFVNSETSSTIIKKIILKPSASDKTYTEMCNLMEKQGVFVSCGSPNDKWILGKWDNEIDFMAWCVALSEAKATKGKTEK